MTETVVEPVLGFLRSYDPGAKIWLFRAAVVLLALSTEGQTVRGAMLGRGAPGPAPTSVGITASPPALQAQVVAINETWLRGKLIPEGRRLFEDTFDGKLHEGELKSRIDRLILPVKPNFVMANNGKDAPVTRDRLYKLWDRIVEEVLVPSGYVAHPRIREMDRIGKIVKRTARQTPRGDTATVLIVKPLKDTDMAPYTTLFCVVIPESFVDDQNILDIQGTWQAWLNSHPRPAYSAKAESYANAKAQSDWVVMNRMGPERDMGLARRLVEEAIMEEELDHWDLFHYLQSTYNGLTPFAFTADQLFDAMAAHVFRPGLKELFENALRGQLGEEDVDFRRLDERAKMAAINRLIELHAQIRVLTRVSEPGLSLLRFNLFRDDIHAGPAHTLRLWLSSQPFFLQLLGKETGRLEDWIPALGSQLTAGLRRGGVSNPSEDAERVKANLTILGNALKQAANQLDKETFRIVPEKTGSAMASQPQTPAGRTSPVNLRSEWTVSFNRVSGASFMLPMLLGGFKRRPSFRRRSPDPGRRLATAA